MENKTFSETMEEFGNLKVGMIYTVDVQNLINRLEFKSISMVDPVYYSELKFFLRVIIAHEEYGKEVETGFVKDGVLTEEYTKLGSDIGKRAKILLYKIQAHESENDVLIKWTEASPLEIGFVQPEDIPPFKVKFHHEGVVIQNSSHNYWIESQMLSGTCIKGETVTGYLWKEPLENDKISVQYPRGDVEILNTTITILEEEK